MLSWGGVPDGYAAGATALVLGRGGGRGVSMGQTGGWDGMEFQQSGEVGTGGVE